MKKILISILILFSINTTINAKPINPNYKKEVVNFCPSFEDRTDTNQVMLIKKYNCIGASKNCFPKEYFDVALDFAKKLKYVYRTKDIQALADIAPYPSVYIENYKNKEFIKIKSKQQLLRLDKNILLNRSMFKKINESYINWSWRGFDFSRVDIMFFIENNKVVMLAINLK